MLLTKDEAIAISTKILSFVKADDAQVSVSGEKTGNLRFRKQRISDKRQHRRTRREYHVVWVKGRSGSASTSDFSDESLRAMVAQAEKVAATFAGRQQYLADARSAEIC